MRYIIKELFAEKTRVILTILAIAWGTFAITTMLAIGEGLRLTFAKAVEGVGKNLLTVTAGTTAKTHRGMANNIPLSFTNEDVATISSLANVSHISPIYNFMVRLYYQKKFNSAQIQAVEPMFAQIRKISLKNGRFISPLDIKLRRNVLVLGYNTAKILFPHTDPMNKYVMIGARPFLVIGVVLKKPALVAIDTPDDFLNWIPFTTYKLLVNPKTVDSLIIHYTDQKFLPRLKQEIRGIVALNHGADPDDVALVDFNDIAKQQNSIEKFFIGLQVFLGIVGGLTLLVAGVGIANVMYAAVTRATHEIGIRKALGATSKRILLHYISESLFATFLGGLLGVILSAGLVVLIRLIPLHGKIIEEIGKPLPVLSPLVMVTVIIVLGIFGGLAGLFPAMKATRIDPAEALIYE